ncbi:MAG TPA: ABC transporter ATP-binding protein, partial [Allosphingosinicella sp.]
LQEVIADYDGTVLIVSHDRDFLDRTVTITLGLDGSGKVDVVAGGYEDWERRRAVSVPAKAGTQPSRKSGAPASAGAQKQTKLTYKDQRDYDLLPARIEELEAQIARDEEALSDPDLYTRDPNRFASITAAIDKARAERDAAEERWLELAEKVEALPT